VIESRIYLGQQTMTHRTATTIFGLLLLSGCFGGYGTSDTPEDAQTETSTNVTVDSDTRTLIDRSVEELRLKTEAHDTAWQIGEAAWELDQDTGLITFTGDKLVATAPAQVIGTYNTDDGTWLWSWDNPSIEAKLQDHALKVREHGQQHNVAALTTRKLDCSEEQAWEWTALACHLSEAQGAYRGPAGSTLVFMTFGKVTLSAAQ
jgi:hypothetical protein